MTPGVKIFEVSHAFFGSLCCVICLTSAWVQTIMTTMRSQNERTEIEGAHSYRELRLLDEVYRTSEASQRDLSKRLNVALGVTNLLLRNLAQKGYIRVTQASWKRWLYTVTPSGMARKVNLTIAYVGRFLNHYRQVRLMITNELSPLALDECFKVAIYGKGEIGELTYISLRDLGIDISNVFDTDANGHRFLGLEVLNIDTIDHREYDKVIIASLDNVDEKHSDLTELGIPSEKIVTLLPRAKE